MEVNFKNYDEMDLQGPFFHFFLIYNSMLLIGLETSKPIPLNSMLVNMNSGGPIRGCLMNGSDYCIYELLHIVFLGLTVFGHMHANFINRFLRLLSEYDWTFSALVVDINNDLGPNDEKEINVSSAA